MYPIEKTIELLDKWIKEEKELEKKEELEKEKEASIKKS